MRIYLVGFMGSGKSTLAASASKSLHVPYLDTDQWIEESQQASVFEIITDKGESFFRELERRALAHALTLNKALISTGGGLPCFHDNMQRMLQDGITIYLQWPWERLRIHLETLSTANRPLLAGDKSAAHWEKIRLLFESRLPFYEQAAMTIEMSDDLEKNELLLLRACNYIWK